MKRTLSLFLTFVMLIGMLPVFAAAEESNTFIPGNFFTTASIVSFFDELEKVQNGKYWNKNLNQQTLINQIEANNFADAVQEKACTVYGKLEIQ